MNFYSYTFSRHFGSYYMPVPAQSLCIREYVAKIKGNFFLPTVESKYSDCYHQLFGLAQQVEGGACIIMYSMLMLPRTEKLELFLNVCKERNIYLGFVLENLVILTDRELLKIAMRDYAFLGLSLKTDRLRQLLNETV